ncbi:MAG: WYL domain-containing protein [Bacteroidota bacterium]
MLEEFTKLFWEAAEKRRCCRIQISGEPLTRVVHPYGICRSSMDKIVLVCWQSMGFTKPGGKEGFRNLVLDNIAEVEMLESHFKLSETFNPKDIQYKEWVFHI